MSMAPVALVTPVAPVTVVTPVAAMAPVPPMKMSMVTVVTAMESTATMTGFCC